MSEIFPVGGVQIFSGTIHVYNWMKPPDLTGTLIFQNPDEDIKISFLKTQSEGAMVDPDDKVANVAEDKEIVSD